MKGLTSAIIEAAIRGWGPLVGAGTLSARVSADRTLRSPAERAAALARQQQTLSFCIGAIGSMGGLMTALVALPITLLLSWFIQARLAAATALLHGHDVDDPQVRELIALIMLGERNIGSLAPTAAARALQVSSPRVLQLAHRGLARQLFRLVGRQGFRQVGRLIPLFGALLGGLIDLSLTRSVGRLAEETFGPPPEGR